MKRARVIACIAGLLLPLAVVPRSNARPPAGPSAVLSVFAAASLADAFTELAHTLERQRPGLVVRLNLAGSQQLATQIEQGAQADVFAPADGRWMGYLAQRGLVSGEPSIFAKNRLVVIVPRPNP